MPNRTLQELLADGFKLKSALRPAMERLQPDVDYEAISNPTVWGLVCNEVLDTVDSDQYYERVIAELYRRGIKKTEINTMIDYVWATAGWLNFVGLLWEWTSMNETHNRRAIELQLEQGYIEQSEAMLLTDFLNRYE